MANASVSALKLSLQPAIDPFRDWTLPNVHRRSSPNSPNMASSIIPILRSSHSQTAHRSNAGRQQTVKAGTWKRVAETPEKRVLAKWKSILKDEIHLSDDIDIVYDLKERGVLTDDNVKAVLQEKDEREKIGLIVDLVLSSESPDGVAALCFALSRSYLHISREIQADVEAEEGEFEVDDDLMREAATVVHRKFGSSKRFCEVDKRDIQELIARKLQLSRADSQRETSRLRDLLVEEKARNSLLTAKCDEIVSCFKVYVKRRASRLVTHSHDTSTTTDALLKSLEDAGKDGVARLHDSLPKFFQRLDAIFTYVDQLVEARENSMQILKLKKEDLESGAGGDSGGIRFDDALKIFVDSTRLKAVEAERKLKQQEASIYRLKKAVIELEGELTELTGEEETEGGDGGEERKGAVSEEIVKGPTEVGRGDQTVEKKDETGKKGQRQTNSVKSRNHVHKK